MKLLEKLRYISGITGNTTGIPPKRLVNHCNSTGMTGILSGIPMELQKKPLEFHWNDSGILSGITVNITG